MLLWCKKLNCRGSGVEEIINSSAVDIYDQPLQPDSYGCRGRTNIILAQKKRSSVATLQLNCDQPKQQFSSKLRSQQHRIFSIVSRATDLIPRHAAANSSMSTRYRLQELLALTSTSVANQINKRTFQALFLCLMEYLECFLIWM